MNQPEFKDGVGHLRVTKTGHPYMVNLESLEVFTQIDVNFEIPYLGYKGVSMSDDVLMKITGLVSNQIDDQISEPKFQGFISSIIGPGFIEYRFTGSQFPVEEFSKVVNNVLRKFNKNLPSIEEILES